MADKKTDKTAPEPAPAADKPGFIKRWFKRQIDESAERLVDNLQKTPEQLKKDLAKDLIGSAVDFGKIGVTSTIAYPLVASSTAGNIIASYLASPEKALDKLAASQSEKTGEKIEVVKSQLVLENYAFREDYKKLISDRSIFEDVVRELPQQVVGGLAGDKLHITNQFKTMVQSGGSMKEFREMQKEMPDLTLTGYVKFRDEANEEASRIGKPKRELGEEAKKHGVKDYGTAIEYLKNKFIERGTKLQYNSIEKDLYGRSFIFSDASEQAQNPAQSLAQSEAVKNAASGIQQMNTPEPQNNPALANNARPHIPSNPGQSPAGRGTPA